MPLYEYLCESCGRTIEAIQSFAEPPLAVCDRCAGALKKLVSAPAFQFKGTGWYVSDYGPSRSTPKTPEDLERIIYRCITVPPYGLAELKHDLEEFIGKA